MCWRNCDDGMLVVCIDDMCRGAGYCMHGDGEIMCPCQYEGDDDDDYEGDYLDDEAESQP